MKKIILITGVRGFLGSAMINYLNRSQNVYEVYGLARHSSSKMAHIIKCDLLNAKAVRTVIENLKPAYIFHFAGGRLSDDRATLEANFETTKNVLDAVMALKLKTRIVLPGSAAEYGNIKNKTLITEECLPKPLGWYGFVKLLQTNLGLFYARQGLDVVVVRMFNICGANTPTTLAIGGFVQQIVAIENEAEPVIRTKNLGGKRDFLDIEDVCRGLWLVAQKGKSGELYNLCSGQSSTIRAMLKDLLGLARVKGIRVEENKQDASISFDVIGDNTKIKSIGKWYTQCSLKDSLKNTLASYRKST